MKKGFSLGVLAILAIGIILLSQRGGEERTVRSVVEQAIAAALDGLNRRNPNGLEGYFATVAEGAQASGLVETQQAYENFVSQLPGGTTVQFHSSNIEAVEVHEDTGLARVTYRLHLSVIRGNVAIFTIRIRQDLALLNTPRGWRISGGDTPQIEEVTGIWPPR